MNNIKQFLSKNKVLMVFVIFFILVLLEHQFLYLFHDDFGYASLSYLPGYDGITGINTNVGDIFNFLIYHYNNWGGRVLYFFIIFIK